MTALPQATLPLRPRRAEKVLYGRKQRQAHNDAWGNELAGNFDNLTGGMPYGFVGAGGCRKDSATGLIYMRSRWYDSGIRRFISRDPLGLTAGPNLYSYAALNPAKLIDPDGKIVRNPDGSIKIFPIPKAEIQILKHATLKCPDGDMAYALPVHIMADDGTLILVYVNLYKDKKPEFTCDCHGLTFGDGRFWINNDQIPDLLRGDNYKPVDIPKIGDVAIYRGADGTIVHSMTVSGVDAETGQITVTGIAGANPNPYTAPAAPGPGGGYDPGPNSGPITVEYQSRP